ncbi:M15 family metallopeptidase [Leptospira sarikeiensis]|uniref:D-alanyl-D-alanine dipeptidase n=1 Tax=Leptospira sarikeiensis TaxID=2484943 RepID=A0A4R9KCB2_9LEPT|nr:M15 family metallopeptidase [Leptospira sarikeiensis]TGL63726.1 peptidase M15 [Leptospira sarikeiensis]
MRFLIFGLAALILIQCEKPVISEQKEILPIIRTENGLVNVKDIDPSLEIDLRYSTSDNFTGSIIYPFRICLLRKETAEKLKEANSEFKTLGYRIKIWDGYRPPYAQRILWDKVPNPRYVGDPNKGGSIHNRGGAVDLTLIDSKGNELEMPSAYDEFSYKASPIRKDLDVRVSSNLEVLVGVLTKHGFKQISSEWWHYNDGNAKVYPLVEVDPKLWEK